MGGAEFKKTPLIRRNAFLGFFEIISPIAVACYVRFRLIKLSSEVGKRENYSAGGSSIMGRSFSNALTIFIALLEFRRLLSWTPKR